MTAERLKVDGDDGQIQKLGDVLDDFDPSFPIVTP
ncbi:alkyl sulfatase C-terminal domain-containing protein [Microbacterium ureisolvens]